MTEEQIVLCGHGSGNPSTKNCYSYLESRYNQFAPNGKRKGLAVVKRFKKLDDAGRKKFHDKYKEILGRNYYNQNLRQYVYHPYNGNYFSDCSSSLCATLQEIGYEIGLLNTAGIYSSNLFETVPVDIQNGHIMNPEILKVGDFLEFVGNDPSRPMQIGHVEGVYSMPLSFAEKKIDATVLVNEDLNVRAEPSRDGRIITVYPKGTLVHCIGKSGTWFDTGKGWISRNYVTGWILEDGRYWYIDNGSYPMHCAMDIGGSEYHFDKDGWMLDASRFAKNGSVVY